MDKQDLSSDANLSSLEYYLPTYIHTEWESLSKIGKYCKSFGSRIIIITLEDEISGFTDHLNIIKNSIENNSGHVIIYNDLKGNPGHEDLNTLSHFIRKSHADLLLGFGGRQTMLITKTASLLSTNNVFAEDLTKMELEDSIAPLPYISVPIGPMMGDEIIPYLSVYNTDTKERSYRKFKELHPVMSFSDPSLIKILEKENIYNLALSSLSGVMESLMSNNTNELIISQSIISSKLIITSLLDMEKQTPEPSNYQNLCVASMIAAMSHANTGVGLIYSLASCIDDLMPGVFYKASNILLANVMEYNLTVKADIYLQLAKEWGEDIQDLIIIEASVKAIEVVRRLSIELKTPNKFSEIEITKEQLVEVAKVVSKTEMISNNSRPINQKSIELLLLSAY